MRSFRNQTSAVRRSAPDVMTRAVEAAILALVFLVPVVIYTGTANANMVKVTVFALGMVILSALGILNAIREGRVRWTRSSLHLPIALYLLWNLVSALTSSYRWISFNEFGKLAGYVFLYLLVTEYLAERKRLERLLGAVIAGATVTSVYGVLQHYGFDWIAWRDTLRLLSSFGNPTFFAAYLVLLMPLVGNLVLVTSSRGTRWALGILFSLMYVCLLLTYTRAAWLGLLFAAVADILILHKYLGVRAFLSNTIGRRIGALAVALLVVSLLVTLRGSSTLNVGQRLASSFQAGEVSNAQRITHWEAAWRMLQHSPVIGTGLGTFQIYAPRYQTNRFFVFGDAVIVDHAHNELLETASETGAIGLAIFLWLIATASALVFRTLRAGTDDWQYLSAGLLCGLIAFAVQNMAGVTMRWVFGGMYFWLFLALIVVSERAVSSGSRIAPPSVAGPNHWTRSPRLLVAASAVLIPGVCLALWLILRPFASEMHAKQGTLAVEQGQLRLARSEFSTAIRLNRYSLLSYYRLGHVYNSTGHYHKACGVFRRLEDLAPDYARIHYNLGAVLTNMDRHSEAAAEYRRALALEDSPNNHMALAELYACTGRQTLAMAESDRAVSMAEAIGRSSGGDPPDLLLRRGRLSYRAGDTEAARRDFESVVQQRYSSKLGHFYLANLYRRLGRRQDAVAQYELALRMDPGDNRVYTNLGASYCDSMQYNRAAKCYESALDINPSDAYAHFGLGLTRMRTGRMLAAQNEMNAAARLGAGTPVASQARTALQELERVK